jgi:hypothetical protein
MKRARASAKGVPNRVNRDGWYMDEKVCFNLGERLDSLVAERGYKK